MASLYNLARMTTATTGTGTITLGSAVSGFLSFAGAGVSNGQTITYAIRDGVNSEIGRGVYTSSGTTLTRTVLKSTNSNTAINLSGSAEVFITPAAEDISKAAADITDASSAGQSMLTAANAAAQVALLAASIEVAAGPVSLISVAGAGYDVDNTGATGVSSTLQSAVTAICGAGKVAYIPDGTYDMGSGTLTVPAYGKVVCSRNAVIRRTGEPSTAAPLIALSAYSSFEGGELNQYVVATSTTSNTIASSGSKVWTVQSGLNYQVGMTLYIWTAANTWMQGTVAGYTGTTLTVTISSSNGSGTYTSWKFSVASADNAAIRAYNVAGARVSGTRITSAEQKWQVGVNFDTATTAIAQDVYVTGAINRAFYAYQTCSDIWFVNCDASGNSICAYGFNVNPANGTCSRIKIVNCTATNMASQGFEFGDNTFKSVMSCCTAETIANTGFLIQVANTAGFPQYNSIVGCTAASCTNYGFVLAGCFYNQITACEAVACGVGLLFGSGQISGGTTYYAQLNTVTGFRADACTTNGIQFITTTLRNSCTGVSCIANGGTGILFDSGSQLNRVSGNAYNNTTANMTDNGTSNVKDVTTS